MGLRTIWTATLRRLPFYGALALALWLGWGWAWAWIRGINENPYITVGNPRVRVREVEKVQYLDKWRTEIREVKVYLPPVGPGPEGERPRWSEEDLREWVIRWEGEIDPLREDVAGIWRVPRAPWGGEFAATLPHDSNELRGVFRPKRRPYFQISPIREVGIRWDGGSFEPYVDVDVLRTGPLVWRVGARLEGLGEEESGSVYAGVAARF